MTPGARSKFGAPMFEPEVFRKQMHVLKKVLVTLLGLFGAPMVIQRPGNCAPFVPFVTPLHQDKAQRAACNYLEFLL